MKLNALSWLFQGLLPDYDIEYDGDEYALVECEDDHKAGALMQAHNKDGQSVNVFFRLPVDCQPGDVLAVRMSTGTIEAITRDGRIVYDEA